MDTALVNRNAIAAPKDYNVPGAQEFILRAVSASIDGSSTTGAWQPALQLVSPAGDVMWTAVNQQLAAGASASVSWFPGVASSPFTPNTGGLWSSYIPVWSANIGAQPALGNGTLAGLYFRLAQFVVCRVALTAGSTTTFGTATGIYNFTLPVPAAVPAAVSFGMSSNSFNQTAKDVITWGFETGNGLLAGWGYSAGSGGSGVIQFITATQPVTWVASDTIRLACLYEAA